MTLSNAIKIILTGLIFAYLFNKYDLLKLYTNFKLHNTLLAIFLCSTFLIIQGILCSLRLRNLASYIKTNIKLKSTWAASSIGGLYSHTPLSFIGGDAMRIVTLSKSGVSIKRLTAIVVLDRLVGVLGLMTLCTFLICSLYVRSLLKPNYLSSMPISAFILIPVFTMITYMIINHKFQTFLLKLLPKKINQPFEYIACLTQAIKYRLASLLLLSIFAYISGIIGFLAINWSLDLNIPYDLLVFFIPLAIFASLIPVSLGGWGIREGATVYVLGLHGVSPQISLTLSITYGVAVFLAFLPGSTIYLIGQSKGKT